MAITAVFHETIKTLVSVPLTDEGAVSLDSDRKASVKDVIEALGVPHTEIGKIEASGIMTPFISALAAAGYTGQALTKQEWRRC